MAENSDDLPCWKKDCDGKLVFIDSGSCFQRWKCNNKKCGSLYTLNHALIAHLKKSVKKKSAP